MDIADGLRAFLTVFPAELPDKTMIATVVLTTRYRRPVLVWVGVAAAFVVHVTVAVTAGRLLSLLPENLVKAVVIVLFTVGAVLLWRGATNDDELEDELEDELDDEVTDEAGERAEGSGGGGRVVAGALATIAGSFGVVLLAEWGDLTQLATASLAADSESPLLVAVGALLALWAVAALAVTAGRTLAGRLPVGLLRRLAAGVFAALAVFSLVELVRG